MPLLSCFSVAYVVLAEHFLAEISATMSPGKTKLIETPSLLPRASRYKISSVICVPFMTSMNLSIFMLHFSSE